MLNRKTACFLIACLVLPAIWSGPAGLDQTRACTAFVVQNGDRVVLAKSFDWHTGQGLITINRRDLKKKTIIVGGPTQKLQEWTSRYGSVTFSWVGVGLPTGGLNEKGLAVTALLFKQSRYPEVDSQTATSPSQWKQMVLDTCASVKDALATLKKVRLYTASRFGQQFMLADKSGDRALVQFREGRPEIFTGEQLPHPVTANDLAYPTALERIGELEGFGGSKPVLSARSSLNRFVLAAAAARDLKGADPLTHARQALKTVRVGRTQWQISYDPREGLIRFNTATARDIRSIDLGRIDFSCHTPLRLMPINAPHEGDLTYRFQEFSPALYGKFLDNLKAESGFSDQVIKALGDYAKDQSCRP